MPSLWKFTQLENAELLTKARQQLHQASQIVAAVGRTYKPKVKDDHFASFLWNDRREMLQGYEIEGEENFSVALNFKTFSIHLLDTSGESLNSFELDGKTQQQSLIWLEEQLVKLGLDGNSLSIQLPYEMPSYPTAKGKEFQMESHEAFDELSNYFSNTNLIVKAILRDDVNASAISCWPHHFDIASLITISDTGDPETSSSIGIGMSPGDTGYDEPYFYLTPWPYPNVSALAEIHGLGKWHTDGWVGGVLTASDLTSNSEVNNQERLVKEFFESGLGTLRELMT